MPPRAKLGVAAATQLDAKVTAKRRRMIVFLLLLCPPYMRDLITRADYDFSRIAVVGAVLRPFPAGALPRQLPSVLQDEKKMEPELDAIGKELKKLENRICRGC